MNNQNPKQHAGMWMDNRNAMLISKTADVAESEFCIQSKLKSKEYHGGKGEHGSNNADKANSQHYFKDVAHLLLPFDEIFIFGPGQAQEEFRNFLKTDAHFNSKKIIIETAERLSDSHMIKRVKEHFA